MIEIGLVIAVAMGIGAFLKNQAWFPNAAIPASIVFLATLFNVVNALLFGGDLAEAGKLALIESLGAIGLHSGLKNTFENRKDDDVG